MKINRNKSMFTILLFGFIALTVQSFIFAADNTPQPEPAATGSVGLVHLSYQGKVSDPLRTDYPPQGSILFGSNLVENRYTKILSGQYLQLGFETRQLYPFSATIETAGGFNWSSTRSSVTVGATGSNGTPVRITIPDTHVNFTLLNMGAAYVNAPAFLLFDIGNLSYVTKYVATDNRGRVDIYVDASKGIANLRPSGRHKKWNISLPGNTGLDKFIFPGTPDLGPNSPPFFASSPVALNSTDGEVVIIEEERPDMAFHAITPVTQDILAISATWEDFSNIPGHKSYVVQTLDPVSENAIWGMEVVNNSCDYLAFANSSALLAVYAIDTKDRIYAYSVYIANLPPVENMSAMRSSEMSESNNFSKDNINYPKTELRKVSNKIMSSISLPLNALYDENSK